MKLLGTTVHCQRRPTAEHRPSSVAARHHTQFLEQVNIYGTSNNDSSRQNSISISINYLILNIIIHLGIFVFLIIFSFFYNWGWG